MARGKAQMSALARRAREAEEKVARLSEELDAEREARAEERRSNEAELQRVRAEIRAEAARLAPEYATEETRTEARAEFAAGRIEMASKSVWSAARHFSPLVRQGAPLDGLVASLTGFARAQGCVISDEKLREMMADYATFGAIASRSARRGTGWQTYSLPKVVPAKRQE